MTQIDLEEWLTSLSGDTPASPSRLPGSDEAIKMTDTSGQKCLELSKLSGPLGSLEKTLLATSLWASTRCYLTWKPQATPAGVTLFRLSPQTPDIDATGAGLLHTPTAKANQLAPSMKSGWNEPLWATPNTMDHLPAGISASYKESLTGVRKNPSNLRDQVIEPVLWATPRTSDGTGGPRQLDEKGRRISKSNPDLKFGANLADQARVWPTPTARDYKDSPNQKDRGERDDSKLAIRVYRGEEASSGSLNPQWVEWLMGYPVGYTDLNN